MIEGALRELIGQVRRGVVSRRQFMETRLALGVTAPLAAQALSAGGAEAQRPALAEPAFVPTRRGGGGALKILMWDAPTMLHPHFGRGLRDLTASRLFYEPLAAPIGDGTFAPVLADELPTLKNGGIAKDGRWVLWKLKKNVTWHDRTPFTADDLVFNWQFALDPGTAASTRPGFLEVSKVDKIDPYTVKVIFEKPQPFWAVVFASGGLIPRHVFESVKGAGAREAVGMIKPVGTGPYRLVEFRTGDVIRAELNPNYHVPNRPYFDRLEIKCGGDSARPTPPVLQTGENHFASYVPPEE